MLAIRYVSSAVVLLLLAHSGSAEFQVSEKCWVKNPRVDPRCAWCCLEMLARQHGIKAMYNIGQDQPRCAKIPDLEEALKKSPILYWLEYPGVQNFALLRHAMKHKLGAMIGLHKGVAGPDKHVVIVTKITSQRIEYLDPNDGPGITRLISPQKLFRSWDGLLIIIKKN
jgi:ABC-type bacteriocin/lantibiotic exporter with double-glycine peptidase domain